MRSWSAWAVLGLAALSTAQGNYGEVVEQFGNIIVKVQPSIAGVSADGDKINGTKIELLLGYYAEYDPEMPDGPYEWCHLNDLTLTIGGEGIPYNPVPWEPTGGSGGGGSQQIVLREEQNVRFGFDTLWEWPADDNADLHVRFH